MLPLSYQNHFGKDIIIVLWPLFFDQWTPEVVPYCYFYSQFLECYKSADAFCVARGCWHSSLWALSAIVHIGALSGSMFSGTSSLSVRAFMVHNQAQALLSSPWKQVCKIHMMRLFFNLTPVIIETCLFILWRHLEYYLLHCTPTDSQDSLFASRTLFKSRRLQGKLLSKQVSQECIYSFQPWKASYFFLFSFVCLLACLQQGLVLFPRQTLKSRTQLIQTPE